MASEVGERGLTAYAVFKKQTLNQLIRGMSCFLFPSHSLARPDVTHFLWAKEHPLDGTLGTHTQNEPLVPSQLIVMRLYRAFSE